MLWVIGVEAVILVGLVVMCLFLVTGLTGAVYVPSKAAQLDPVFTKLYKMSAKDVIVDLGVGDGVVLRAAVRHGAREAHGVELNPVLVLWTRVRLRREPKIRIHQGNMYSYRLPEETTVVYAYVDMFNIARVYRRVCAEAERLGRPLVLIANAFNPTFVRPERTLGQHYLYRVEPGKMRAKN